MDLSAEHDGIAAPGETAGSWYPNLTSEKYPVVAPGQVCQRQRRARHNGLTWVSSSNLV